MCIEIKVETDALPNVDGLRLMDLREKMPNLTEEEEKEVEHIEAQKEKDQEVRDRIKDVLAEIGSGEDLRIDERTGESLCGGNTFIEIKPLD